MGLYSSAIPHEGTDCTIDVFTCKYIELYELNNGHVDKYDCLFPPPPQNSLRQQKRTMCFDGAGTKDLILK